MPRIVTASEKLHAIKLMREGVGQRDIQRETGLSRPFIRKIAREIGHQFIRNGIERVGHLCMCANCGILFRRPASRITDKKHQFCDVLCREAFMKGPNHPSWKTGKTAKSFSEWVKNQSAYHEWKERVLARDGYRCVVSGVTENLEVHHINPKVETESPEKAFDINNGITLSLEAHDRIHTIVREGYSFEDAIEKLKEEYANKVN